MGGRQQRRNHSVGRGGGAAAKTEPLWRGSWGLSTKHEPLSGAGQEVSGKGRNPKRGPLFTTGLLPGLWRVSPSLGTSVALGLGTSVAAQEQWVAAALGLGIAVAQEQWVTVAQGLGTAAAQELGDAAAQKQQN